MYLLPKWLKYSRNVALLPEDTTLANDQHAEILPCIPDVDAIRSKCYVIKGAKKVQMLNTKTIQLYLHIELQLVSEADFRRTQFQEGDAPEISAILTHVCTFLSSVSVFFSSH